MDGLLVSNKIHFIGIWSLSNLGQVAITVPTVILFLHIIHHGLSFLIYFKPNLLLFLSVSLRSCYLHFSSCQYWIFNMGFLSLLSLSVSMPINAKASNYNHNQAVSITLWSLILRHPHSSPQQFMPTATKVNVFMHLQVIPNTDIIYETVLTS